MELQHAAGTLFDQLADLVAVPGAVFHQRQDQDLGAPLDVRAQFVRHMWHCHTYMGGCGQGGSG